MAQENRQESDGQRMLAAAMKEFGTDGYEAAAMKCVCADKDELFYRARRPFVRWKK